MPVYLGRVRCEAVSQRGRLFMHPALSNSSKFGILIDKFIGLLWGGPSGVYLFLIGFESFLFLLPITGLGGEGVS